MSKSRLMEQVRDTLRVHHYSLRTERAYLSWIKRFILFHGKRHPGEMGETEVTAFLSYLASEKHLAACTQNQVLSTCLFVYKNVLMTWVVWPDGKSGLSGRLADTS